MSYEIGFYCPSLFQQNNKQIAKRENQNIHSESVSSVEKLTSDLFIVIFSKLTISENATVVPLVCKRWQKLSSDPYLWKVLFLTRWSQNCSDWKATLMSKPPTDVAPDTIIEIKMPTDKDGIMIFPKPDFPNLVDYRSLFVKLFEMIKENKTATQLFTIAEQYDASLTATIDITREKYACIMNNLYLAIEHVKKAWEIFSSLPKKEQILMPVPLNVFAKWKTSKDHLKDFPTGDIEMFFSERVGGATCNLATNLLLFVGSCA
jgi:hypothetical protein